MDNRKNLSFFHVVPNATFRIKLWPQWVSLIKAAYYGDLNGERISQNLSSSYSIACTCQKFFEVMQRNSKRCSKNRIAREDVQTCAAHASVQKHVTLLHVQQDFFAYFNQYFS